MDVEPDAVWVGLVMNGEWGSSPGGLLRFDRATERATVWKLDDEIGAIQRVGDRILLATDFGVAILENDRLHRDFVDKTTDERWRIVQADAFVH